jgi:RNA polymerase sigma factor (sigma-70 family)
MKHPSALNIVGGFNRREAWAFDWIYREYYSAVFGIVIKLTGSPVDAEDLVADVFAKLLKRSERFGSLKTIRNFLFHTARNSCINWRKRRGMVIAREREIRQHYQYDDYSPLHVQDMRDSNLTVIHRAIEKLPGQSKQILCLYYLDGLRHSEIATALGITKKTVANSKSLAVSRLKEILRTSGHLILVLIHWI